MSERSQTRALRVVVAGGGVGAIETLLALKDLAGRSIRLTVVTPNADFELRALRTIGALQHRSTPSTSIRAIARASSAELRLTSLRRVVPEEHVTLLSNGGRLGYDVLVIAIGAREAPAYAHGTITYGAERPGDDVAAVVADLEAGHARSAAFVAPGGTTWTLPLYELALRAAERVGDRAELHLVTPERAPLSIFGEAASSHVSMLLRAQGIRFHGASYAAVVSPGRLRLTPGGRPLAVDRVVALPTLEGPVLRGLPRDARGFIPIEADGRVRGVRDVYAIGDATTFPVKQGGIACQLADTVAHQIAAQAGIPVAPLPFRPVLRGQLVTDAGASALQTAIHGGAGVGTATGGIAWQPARKINGRYLSALLDEDPRLAGTRGEPIDVTVELDPLGLEPYSPVIAEVDE